MVPGHTPIVAGATPRLRAQDLPLVHETSAGGVVVAVQDGEAFVALIARRNRAGRIEWCLPKGHIEGSETPTQTAVREVFEETGIHGQVLAHLATITYSFSSPHRRVNKMVYHFLLEALGGEISVAGDPDQEAVDAAWIPLLTAQTLLAYANERRVVRKARDLLWAES
ncbi:MAG: NUDIX hydrolase [Actinomycetaceae bacterium]|nr:NUDIX hydrolase [Actinomycetaceae bacterium]